VAFFNSLLTVKLKGRTTTPESAEGAQSLGARGAKQTTHHGPLQRLLGAQSHSDKVWNSNEGNPQHDEQSNVGNEIRKDHQGKAADQWHNPLLPSAEHEEAKPN
jgi:hypothetical protein